MRLSGKVSWRFLVVAVLILSLVIAAGCGGGKKEPAKDQKDQKVSKLNLTITGGSIGGAWAAIGEGVGEVIRRSYPGSNTAYEVGQEAANVSLVSRGKVQLGIAHSGLLKMAIDGKEPFKNKMDNLRALTVLYGEAAQHLIVRADSGITSYADIKSKKYPIKINENTKASFMEIVGRECLKANGISYADIAAWGGKVDFMSMSSSLDLMRDGKLDAYSNVIQVPASHVIDLATTTKLVLLPMSDEAIAKVNAELGTYKTVIPKAKYGFLKEDVPTVAATVVLFTSKELPDAEAYAIIKAIEDNMKYFQGIHGSLKGLDLKAMTKVSPVPLHPGAEKYYKEKGAL